MGNNQAFTDFETTVLSTYNKGVLDKQLLSSFMEMHRGTDVDSGGKVGTIANDGLDVEEIVIKIFTGEAIKYPALPKDHNTWTEEQESANEAYWDKRYDAFSEITNSFGWC